MRRFRALPKPMMVGVIHTRRPYEHGTSSCSTSSNIFSPFCTEGFIFRYTQQTVLDSTRSSNSVRGNFDGYAFILSPINTRANSVSGQITCRSQPSARYGKCPGMYFPLTNIATKSANVELQSIFLAEYLL